MTLSPFFRSPFTDITGGMVSHQLLGRCMHEESRYMECLEVYGIDRGVRKCEHLSGDFHECQTMAKQYKRFVAIRRERERQIAEGKLTGDKKFVTPKVDSY